MGHQRFSHSHEFRRWFCPLQLWDLRQAQLLSACFSHLEDVVSFISSSISFTNCIPRLAENEMKWYVESPWQQSTHWEHSLNVNYWCCDAFVQFSSIQSCLTLCNSMDCSASDFPVHYQLPELAQIHVHQVGDAIQLSHPLLYPSPTFNLSQHQGLFQWVSSLLQMTKVLELQLQYQSFQ